jgi:hypothetical protein
MNSDIVIAERNDVTNDRKKRRNDKRKERRKKRKQFELESENDEQQSQEEQRRQEEEQRQREEVERREEEERRQRLERENVERREEEERRLREEVELRVEIERRVREEVERRLLEHRQREEFEHRQSEDEESQQIAEENRPSFLIKTWDENRPVDDVIDDIDKVTQFTEAIPKGRNEVGHQFYQEIERDGKKYWGLSTVIDIRNDGAVIITSTIDGDEVEGRQTLGASEYNNLMNSKRIVHLQISKHQEIYDPHDVERYTLSDVEREVVCHGSRNETDAAKLQRRLLLLYGLNLTAAWYHEEKKRIILAEIERVIQEMKDLGVEGADAARSNVETQAAAFSPISRHEKRPKNRAYTVSSSIPCHGTPNLVQATSALITETNLSNPGVEYMLCPERFGKKRKNIWKLKENRILVVSDNNLWFIAFHDKKTDTVGLYISGSPDLESKNYRTLNIPGHHIVAGKQYSGMNEHILFCWIFATNFYPLEDHQGEHINGIPQDNRRSNVPLRSIDENSGNKRARK